MRSLAEDGVEGFGDVNAHEVHGVDEAGDELEPFKHQKPLDDVLRLARALQQERGVAEGLRAALEDGVLLEDGHRQRHVHDGLALQQVRADLLHEEAEHLALLLHELLVDELRLAALSYLVVVLEDEVATLGTRHFSYPIRKKLLREN